MTVRGHRDQRIINLARALVEVGFTCLAPHFPAISNQEIHPGTWQDCGDLLHAVLRDRDLCPDGRIALLGPSFSGSVCLRAATLDGVREHVSSIVTIGAYANVRTIFDHFFRSTELDEYGKLIALWNFAEYGTGKNKAVKDALKVAILDNGLRRTPDEEELPAVYNALKPKDRELFDRLRNDSAYRVELWEKKISVHPALQEWIAEMECAEKLVGDMAPVALVHGSEDDVIPPSESELLHARLNQLGVANRLCLTGLISHGDSGLKASMIPEAFRLAATFGFFFKNIG